MQSQRDKPMGTPQHTRALLHLFKTQAPPDFQQQILERVAQHRRTHMPVDGRYERLCRGWQRTCYGMRLALLSYCRFPCRTPVVVVSCWLALAAGGLCWVWCTGSLQSLEVIMHAVHDTVSRQHDGQNLQAQKRPSPPEDGTSTGSQEADAHGTARQDVCLTPAVPVTPLPGSASDQGQMSQESPAPSRASLTKLGRHRGAPDRSPRLRRRAAAEKQGLASWQHA